MCPRHLVENRHLGEMLRNPVAGLATQVVNDKREILIKNLVPQFALSFRKGENPEMPFDEQFDGVLVAPTRCRAFVARSK
jgi:hypothetical protein